jgi:hypothetical protein
MYRHDQPPFGVLTLLDQERDNSLDELLVLVGFLRPRKAYLNLICILRLPNISRRVLAVHTRWIGSHVGKFRIKLMQNKIRQDRGIGTFHIMVTGAYRQQT